LATTAAWQVGDRARFFLRFEEKRLLCIEAATEGCKSVKLDPMQEAVLHLKSVVLPTPLRLLPCLRTVNQAAPTNTGAI